MTLLVYAKVDTMEAIKLVRKLAHGQKNIKYDLDGKAFCYLIVRQPSPQEVCRNTRAQYAMVTKADSVTVARLARKAHGVHEHPGGS